MDEKDKIKVFGNDDESLKLFGHLLTNDSSRKIIRVLIEKEMYKNQIAKKLGISLNLVSHHLKKLEESGLVIVTEKPISTKGEKHKHYKMIPNIFVNPTISKQEMHESGFLKKFFKPTIKFASIGIVSLFVWSTNFMEKNIDYHTDDQPPFYFTASFYLLLIIFGLIAERIISKKRKRG